jgi:hypothetical protein
MNRFYLFATCFLYLVSLLGCGGGEGDTYVDIHEAPESCVPGHMETCLCPGAQLGFQVCSENGTSYSACECPNEPKTDAGAEASPTEDAAPGTDAKADSDTDAQTDAGTDADAEAGNDADADIVQPDAEYCELMTGIIVYGYYGCCGAFNQSDIAQLKTGDLIKAGGGGNYRVYYYGSDGKRYVFPSSVELDSWYAPLNANNVPVHDYNSVCNSVLEIPEAQLAQIPLGGNVTKRPGAYSTGIYTDTQRYVVDHYRTLRPVSQAILDEIYDGPIQEHDFITPDSFFVNYTLASPITDASQFDHLLKYNTAMIEVELGIKSCYPGTYVPCTCPNGTQSQTLCGVNYEPLECSCADDCPPYSPQSTLTITENGHPGSDIVIGGKDVWVPMARYQACVDGNEDVKLSTINVQWRVPGQDWAAESFSLVGVASQGNVIGTAQFDNNNLYGAVDVELDSNLTIAKGSCQPIELWAKFAAIKSSQEANGEWAHQPRSGKSVSLRISESLPTYGTTAYCNVEDYIGKLDVKARGLTTGEKVFADEGAAQPNFMTVRKAKPVVVPQALTSTVLTNGQQEVAVFQIGADSASAMAVKQLPFYLARTTGTVMHSFRLYRGAVELPHGSYHIVDMMTGEDLTDNITEGPVGYPIVSFTDEEIVSGTGNIYSLKAISQLIGTGNNFACQFMAHSQYTLTGHLVGNESIQPPEHASPHFYHVQNSSGGWDLGIFIMSDMSEAPHGQLSEDWFADYLFQIPDFTWSRQQN